MPPAAELAARRWNMSQATAVVRPIDPEDPRPETEDPEPPAPCSRWRGERGTLPWCAPGSKGWDEWDDEEEKARILERRRRIRELTNGEVTE